MARLRIEGVDGLAEELAQMGQLTGPLADAMLKAGVQPIVEVRKAEAIKRRHVDTGQMVNAIAADRKVNDTGDGSKSITVYARGVDKKGVRNAEKEFLRNYGTSKMDADHWVEAANEKAEPQALAAMTGVFDHFIEKGVVPLVSIKR